MARKVNHKGRSKSDGRHVRLYYWMLRSEAWKALSGDARALLVAFYQRYDGNNNGDIGMSVAEAAIILHRSENTAHARIRELVEKGFIRVSVPGSFAVKHRVSTRWALTEFPVGTAPATKDFMRWAPENQKTVAMAATDGVNHCDRRSQSLRSSEKLRPSRSQKSKPSEAPNAADGRNHCHEYSLPGMGGAESEAPKPSPQDWWSAPEAAFAQAEMDGAPAAREPDAGPASSAPPKGRRPAPTLNAVPIRSDSDGVRTFAVIDGGKASAA